MLGNVAAADARWLQLAGGANFAGGSLEGLQLSVGANVAGAFATGVQTSIGANVVHGALNGVAGRGRRQPRGPRPGRCSSRWSTWVAR